MLAAIDWQYSQALTWVILVLGALSLLTLLLYPAQLRHIPQHWRWAPPTLRIVAISTIAISILRPVITRPRTASEQGPIVLLLDDSRSMAVVDSSRSPAEWVAIAAALGKLPLEAHDKQIEALQADCDHLSTLADEVVSARAELDYAHLSGRGSDAAHQRLDRAVTDLQSSAHTVADKSSAFPRARNLARDLAYLVNVPAGANRDNWLDRIRDKARAAAVDAEHIRSERDAEQFITNSSVREACLPFQSMSRLQLAEAAAMDPEAGLIARMGANAIVLGFGIGDRVTPFSTSATATTQPLIADGAVSNLTGGIRVVLESMSANPPRAVVLFSDGRQVDAEAGTNLNGVPIYTVAVAARSGSKDLSIGSATVESSGFVGDTITFRAQLNAFGLTGAATQLTFSGIGPDEIRPIEFSDDRPIAVSFTRQLTSPGTVQLSLQIASVPGEASYENNRVERWINVLPRPAKAAPSRGNPLPATKPADEAELTDLTGDENSLRRLAEISGGQFLRLDQVDSLPSRLATIRQDVNHPVEIPLWDSVWVYALVLGCLTIEWGIRKNYGLP